jgi:hypothetical protein
LPERRRRRQARRRGRGRPARRSPWRASSDRITGICLATTVAAAALLSIWWLTCIYSCWHVAILLRLIRELHITVECWHES